MKVGPEGGSLFSLQGWMVAQENVFEGYLFRWEHAQADTEGSCTWPLGASIKPSCPLVKGPGPLKLYELCFWLSLA